MNERDGRIAGGLVMILAGVWLALQAIAGDLAGRLLSWAKPACEGATCDDAATTGDVSRTLACCKACPDKTVRWATGGIEDVIPCRDFIRLIENDPGRA